MKGWIPFFTVLHSVLFTPKDVTAQQGMCRNVYAADVVFVVDGSSSIGRTNFRIIKTFMEGLVIPFVNVVSQNGVRFGVVQYSDDPRTEFTLSRYANGTEVMEAIRNLGYKSGNTRTGAGLKYAADNFFGPTVTRPGVSKIVILITDGKSQDDVDDPSLKLKNKDVKVFAVGIKNADTRELKTVASTPTEEFFFYVTDFKILGTLLPLVSRRVCTTTGGILVTDSTTGPSNLIIAEQTADSMRIQWTEADGPVTGYRVQYVPLTSLGQQITTERKELSLAAGETVTVLQGLRAGTEYHITVIAQYANNIGESVSGKGRTMALSGVSNFRVVEAGSSFLRLAWVPGGESLQGYKIIYKARGDAQGEEKAVSASAVSHTLLNLLPNTEYIITIYPLYLQQTGVSSTISGKTQQLEGVQRFSAQNISSHGMVVMWTGVRGVTGYRISWELLSGGQLQNVDVEANKNAFAIQNLQANTNYLVKITPLYGTTEGPATSIRVKTGQ